MVDLKKGAGFYEKRKKTIVTGVAVVLIAVTAVYLWLNKTLTPLDLKADEILEVSVFDGTIGKGTHIKDKEELKRIV